MRKKKEVEHVSETQEVCNHLCHSIEPHRIQISNCLEAVLDVFLLFVGHLNILVKAEPLLRVAGNLLCCLPHGLLLCDLATLNFRQNAACRGYRQLASRKALLARVTLAVFKSIYEVSCHRMWRKFAYCGRLLCVNSGP